MAIKYRKKPVVVEAMQWDGSVHGFNGADAIEKWSGGAALYQLDQSDPTEILLSEKNKLIPTLKIFTLEGTMIAKPGDWIIRGVKGEFYACKDEIFKQTYERAPDVEIDFGPAFDPESDTLKGE